MGCENILSWKKSDSWDKKIGVITTPILYHLIINSFLIFYLKLYL